MFVDDTGKTGVKISKPEKATIKDPQQIIAKQERYIQTMRLKIAKLEKYFDTKIVVTKNPVFESAKLKHLFGIDKTQKIRASGKIEAAYAGFHHDKGWKLVKKGKVKFLTEPVVCPKTGMVKVERFMREGFLHDKPKTFFPPEWSRSKVIDKIFEASEHIVEQSISGNRRELVGMTQEGMRICMIVDENKKLITAYPEIKQGA